MTTSKVILYESTSYSKYMVKCPVINKLMDAGDCADYCEFYDDDRHEECLSIGVPCNYKSNEDSSQ